MKSLLSYFKKKETTKESNDWTMYHVDQAKTKRTEREIKRLLKKEPK